MKTQDLLFVAWIEATTDYTFRNYKVVNPHKKIYEFEYEIEEDEEKSLKMKYYRSEASKVNETLKTLKKILK